VVAHPLRDAVWVGGLAAPRPHALPGWRRRTAARGPGLLLRRNAASSSTKALACHRRRLLQQESTTPCLEIRESLTRAFACVRLRFVDVANLRVGLETLLLLLEQSGEAAAEHAAGFSSLEWNEQRIKTPTFRTQKIHDSSSDERGKKEKAASGFE
jgi:hypothetical protein